MEDFQKIIVQMLKVQIDHQQESDKRQQKLKKQRVQQQRNEERLLQALMKSEERQIVKLH